MGTAEGLSEVLYHQYHDLHLRSIYRPHAIRLRRPHFLSGHISLQAHMQSPKLKWNEWGTGVSAFDFVWWVINMSWSSGREGCFVLLNEFMLPPNKWDLCFIMICEHWREIRWTFEFSFWTYMNSGHTSLSFENCDILTVFLENFPLCIISSTWLFLS